jgi:hypothetical protein
VQRETGTWWVVRWYTELETHGVLAETSSLPGQRRTSRLKVPPAPPRGLLEPTAPHTMLSQESARP